MADFPSIQRFKELVALKSFRPKTKKEYVRCVRRLSDHFGRDPALLSEEDLRTYFLHVIQIRGWGPSPTYLAKYSLRCFYREFLRIPNWTVFEELRVIKSRSIPIVLHREEVAALFRRVDTPCTAACLRLIYHTGLRVGEAVGIEIRDLHQSRTPQPRLHVRNAKGGRKRFVPVSPEMIAELRRWWRTHRNPKWLFPSTQNLPETSARRKKKRKPNYGRPISVHGVQAAFRRARKRSAIHSGATVHTLRHSYATHLMEEGISLRQISHYLGHRSVETTALYTHLTPLSEARTLHALRTLHQAVTPGSTHETNECPGAPRIEESFDSLATHPI